MPIANSELYKKHRPQKLNDVVGQTEACRQIWNALKMNRLAHTCLFSGPSGTGKTTLMKILAPAAQVLRTGLRPHQYGQLPGHRHGPPDPDSDEPPAHGRQRSDLLHR
jgi:Holliday junction resolvasome RuvABC ATP-dependent DNA helicase subunit